MGLPIEAVNSAAEFFVRRIEGWRDELELVRSSEHARLFRPSPTLFLLLKIARLSAQDLEDCLALLAKCDTPFDLERVLHALSVLGPSESAAGSEDRVGGPRGIASAAELRRWRQER